MHNDQQRNLGLGLVAAGVVAAVGFFGTARAVSARKTHETDRKLRQRVRHDATVETPHGQVIERAQKVGKWYVQTPLAMVGASLLWRGGHRRAAGAVALASASSALTAELMDKVIFRRPPPPGHPKQTTPSFPSGHAIQMAAVSLTAGYVTMREQLAPAAITMPLAIALPLASSGGRLWQDRHWASDVLGGWLAAIVLASWCSAAYELMPPDRPRSRSAALRERMRPAARRTRRAGPGIEQAIARTVERAADTVGRVRERVIPRKAGLLDIARAFAEDVLLRR